MPGIEPGAFHMQSERATTALHPLLMYNVNLCFLSFCDSVRMHMFLTRVCWKVKLLLSVSVYFISHVIEDKKRCIFWKKTMNHQILTD